MSVSSEETPAAPHPHPPPPPLQGQGPETSGPLPFRLPHLSSLALPGVGELLGFFFFCNLSADCAELSGVSLTLLNKALVFLIKPSNSLSH